MSRRRKRNYQRNYPCWILRGEKRNLGLLGAVHGRGYPFQRPLRAAYRRGRRLAF